MVNIETIRKIESIFQQGDHRYNSPEDAVLVADFLEKKAIEIKKEILTDIKIAEGEVPPSLYPQGMYKIIGTRHLKKKGFDIVGYEQWYNGAKTDILAKNFLTNELVVVECCSCRISKVLELLEKENTTLWILSLGENGSEDKELPLFIIKRGETWEENFKKYKEYMLKETRKITSVLEGVFS